MMSAVWLCLCFQVSVYDIDVCTFLRPFRSSSKLEMEILF